MKRYLSIAAALAITISTGTIGTGALAQVAASPTTDLAATHFAAASAVGHWLYDQQGNIIGSVRSLTDDGQTAVIMVGSYFQPGSHEARISTGALSDVNGKTTLQNATVQALNIVPRR